MRSSLTHPPRLTETLMVAAALLRSVRRTIAESGHLETVQDVDTLVAMAQMETEKALQSASGESAGRSGHD